MLVCFAFHCGALVPAPSAVVLVPGGERGGVNGSVNGGNKDS